jgi:proline dehydrogenase
MGVMRSALLAAARSEWLKSRAPGWPFVKKAVGRFMPGEDVGDAIAAARTLRERLSIGSVFTRLGEDLGAISEADRVARHYLDVLDRVDQQRLDVEISVKPTQLGLTFGRKTCMEHLETIAERTAVYDNWLWIDMESTAYTDVTLEMYHALRRRYPKVGVCVQAYLYRTAKDVEELIAAGAGVRLVKGAYLEPKELAYPAKRDVDENFFTLAKTLIGTEARAAGVRAIFGTHDGTLIRRIEQAAAELGVSKRSLEFQMLYGIQRKEQERLARSGSGFRVLIAYGDAWFAWYMRRLAERPANVLFVVKNMVS